MSETDYNARLYSCTACSFNSGLYMCSRLPGRKAAAPSASYCMTHL